MTPKTTSFAELTGRYSAEHIAAFSLYRNNNYSVRGLDETTQKNLAREDRGIAREIDALREQEEADVRAAYEKAANELAKAAPRVVARAPGHAKRPINVANIHAWQRAVTSYVSGDAPASVADEMAGLLARCPVDQQAALLIPLVDSLRRLHGKVKALESRPTLKYVGVWESDESYPEQTAVTLAGCLWISTTKSHGVRPGDGHVWKLAVKKGADGKGAP